MNTFGNVTPLAVWLTLEAHKLHREFPIVADVFSGGPVKLNTVGQITPLVTGDSEIVRIGYSIHNRSLTDVNQPFPYQNGSSGSINATIAMRGFLTINALSGAAVTTGPVKFAGMVTNPNYVASVGASQGDPGIPQKVPSYINAVIGTDLVNDGWAVTTASASGQTIEVVLK